MCVRVRVWLTPFFDQLLGFVGRHGLDALADPRIAGLPVRQLVRGPPACVCACDCVCARMRVCACDRDSSPALIH